ncbi:hypothetical protein [Streptomyces glaucus]|uniref:Uncharacterized protein n=1 Tax=Streptomyces glaucus TaxID=284029 RepID=A0ABN3K0R8_9ACTN
MNGSLREFAECTAGTRDFQVGLIHEPHPAEEESPAGRHASLYDALRGMSLYAAVVEAEKGP